MKQQMSYEWLAAYSLARYEHFPSTSVLNNIGKYLAILCLQGHASTRLSAIMHGLNVLYHITQSELLLSLRICTLGGVRTNIGTLRQFVSRRTLLDSLSLAELHLSRGSFETLIKDLEDRGTHLTHLHLDDLFQDERGGRPLLRFEAAGEPKYKTHGSVVGPSTMTLDGEAASQPVTYRFADGRLVGSTAFEQ